MLLFEICLKMIYWCNKVLRLFYISGYLLLDHAEWCMHLRPTSSITVLNVQQQPLVFWRFYWSCEGEVRIRLAIPLCSVFVWRLSCQLLHWQPDMPLTYMWRCRELKSPQLMWKSLRPNLQILVYVQFSVN